MTKKYSTELEIDLVEILDKFSSEEWNTAISSRLESMSRYLGSDEWKKGVLLQIEGAISQEMAKDSVNELKDLLNESKR